MLSVSYWARRIVAGALLLLLVALVVGSAYEWRGRRQAARDFPVPGRLIDVGGRRIQLDCRGAGSPTVVFESGLDLSGSLAWSPVHDSVAVTTRACAYSRAGILWSDPSEGPHNGAAVAADLHATLGRAGEQAPFILVGHSLGGPYVMTYTKRYPDQVAGLVLVEATHPDMDERLRTPGLWRVAAALAWTGLVRAGLPVEERAREPRAAARAMAAYASTSLGASVQELDALDATLAEAGTFRRLGARPLVVLTAGAPLTARELAAQHKTRAQGEAFQVRWQALQSDLATWSSRSRHELVPDARHEIQFDRPDVVIAATRSVVDSVRAQSRNRDRRETVGIHTR